MRDWAGHFERFDRAKQRRICREWFYTLAPFVVLAGLLFFVWVSA